MTNLEKIQRALRDKDRALILPNALKTVEVKFADWQKQDDSNNLIPNSYYLIPEIAEMFNFTLVSFGENHFVLFYGLRENGEIKAIHEKLKKETLVNFRDNPEGEYALEPKEIDIQNLAPNAYGIFSFAEYREFDLSVFDKKPVE